MFRNFVKEVAEKYDEKWITKLLTDPNAEDATERIHNYKTFSDRFEKEKNPLTIGYAYLKNLAYSKIPVDPGNAQHTDRHIQLEVQKGMFGNMKLRNIGEIHKSLKKLKDSKKTEELKILAGVLYVQGSAVTDGHHNLIEKVSGAFLVGREQSTNDENDRPSERAKSNAALVKHNIVGFAVDDHSSLMATDFAEYYEVCTCLLLPRDKIITARNVFDLITICKAVTSKKDIQKLLDGVNPDSNVPSTSSYIPTTSEKESLIKYIEHDDAEDLCALSTSTKITVASQPSTSSTSTSLPQRFIVVALGYDSYELDEKLFHLGKKLSKKTSEMHKVQYLFDGEILDEETAGRCMENYDAYDAKKLQAIRRKQTPGQEGLRLEPCDEKEKWNWEYCLSPLFPVKSYPDTYPCYGICHWITLPMVGLNRKCFQITRKNTTTTTLTHFAKEVYLVMNGVINYEIVTEPNQLS